MGGPADVWVVAGPPGSGKSTLCDVLMPLLSPVPALLDKDVLYRPFASEVLALGGRSQGEREGPWYDEHVKVHEYGGMTAAARQIRSAGCPVALVAPFTGFVRDVDAWARWTHELGGGVVRLVWVRTDRETLASRLAGRDRAVDDGKRADFEAFVARMQPDVPPPVPHLEVDNRLGARPLAAQLAQLVGRSDIGP